MAIAVIVTIPQDKADEMAKLLVEKRVCACVNIIPGVKSYFWWDNKIDEANESILMIKTKDELFDRLKETVEANHPYEVPEIISFKISGINKSYLEWLEGEASAS